MVEHQSKEIVDKMSEELKIQPALQLPRNIINSIQPVYNVNPVPGFSNVIRTQAGLASDATTATIITTHAIKRTFIIGINISVTKSALATSTLTTVRGLTKGRSSAQDLLSMRYEPTTAASNLNIIRDYSFPIELEKNSLVTITNNNATASIDAGANLIFFEVDPL